MKEGAPKADTITIPTDQRIGKYPNRRDHQVDGERGDAHRRNRQIDNWRNNRDAEKHRNQQQKQVQERPPSPETWRKPIEHAKPASPEAPARLGKAASAVELAQVFSKSVSDPNVGERASGARGIPSRTQVPFSRLMGPTPRPQINGY